MLMAEGMRKVGLDAAAMRDWLASVRGWPGIGHEFSFNKRREGVHDVVIVKAKPGTKELEMVQHLKLQ
jgi:branched-chain amino acid transport system substrate-binding protein